MKKSIVLIFLLPFLYLGCTIPCDVYFRNFSTETLRLQATLVERRFFDKLPNKVEFYDTAQKKKQWYGEWKYSKLVTWLDSTTFIIDVPLNSVIDVSDVSNGLVLGGRSPDVLLTVSKGNKMDTLTTGLYPSLAQKFQRKWSFLGKHVYYYDVR